MALLDHENVAVCCSVSMSGDGGGAAYISAHLFRVLFPTLLFYSFVRDRVHNSLVCHLVPILAFKRCYTNAWDCRTLDTRVVVASI